eukprot:COSAG03_NODE_730_length_6062_cov_9.830790_4_plen_70_part_00
MTSVITLDSTSVATLAQATERNPPPLILPRRNAKHNVFVVHTCMPDAKLRHLPLLCPTIAEHYARSDVA